MKEKLSNILNFIKNRPLLSAAAVILLIIGYITLTNPPKIMRGASDYIGKGDIYFDKGNYEEALDYYRKAKYYAAEDFEVNFKIVQSLVQLTP